MKILRLSDAKNRLSRIVDEVAERDERVMITRNGRPAADDRALPAVRGEPRRRRGR